GHRHRQEFRLEPLSFADGARPRRHQPLDLRADELGLGLPVTPLEIGNDALVRGLVPAPLSLARLVLDPEWIAVVAVEDDLPLLHGELAERLIHRDLVAAGDRLDQVVVEVRGGAQAGDRTLPPRAGLFPG